ncbi:MAG: sugar phosphate isomerase/epimerase family protein [Verrucomicrobiota bacterium]
MKTASEFLHTGEMSRRAFLAATASCLTVAGMATGAPKPFKPRFAICNEVFGDWPFDKAFAFAAEAGYQGIEFAPFTVANDVRTVSAARRKQVRAQAAEAGLEILGLHWLLAKTDGFHLTSADEKVRRETTAYLKALTHFCADLGGRLLIFGSPQQRSLAPGMTRAEGLQHAAEIIHGLLPVMEERDVTLALEPLSPKSTNFLSTAAEAVELIDKVKSPRCRLILDCLAMSTESSAIPDLIRRHKEHLVHVQVNDPNRQGPGFGELDFVPILSALREIEYRGWLSVEVFDFSPGPERLARESISYLKACLK